jgi:hypothetical protein
MTTETTTHEFLIQELLAIPSEPRGWNSRRAAVLLSLAMRKFAGVARAEGADPAEAVTAAWEIWKEPAVLAAENAWAFTTTAVRRQLRKAGEAQRKLTSEEGLRRKGIEEFESSTDESLELLVAPEPVSEEQAPAFKTSAAREAAAMLESHGYTRATAEAAVEAMLSAATVTSSPQSAADLVDRITDVPASLGISRAEWKAVGSVLFGSPRLGGIGLLEAELTGVDPSTIKHIRLARARFERALVAA